MTSLFGALRKSFKRRPLTPLQFPTSGFTVFDDSVLLEEENVEDYKSGQYCPVNIGDVYFSKYQVLGKLGFGSTSTVWLARNLQDHKYVTLKLFRRDVGQDEFKVYTHISQANPSHAGFPHVRTALDAFQVPSENGPHQCLVQKPMWDSWRGTLIRHPAHRFTPELLKAGLYQLFLALDYLHTECKLVHTDIKADNVMQELVDKSVLDDFVDGELKNPSPRKRTANGTTVYGSRRFGQPSEFGNVVLGDFGSAVRGDVKRIHDAQPNVYRPPEVMLKTAWSYPVDIWNVGVMIWDLLEERHLFSGHDTERGDYTTRAHLAELVALLGPPPLDLLQRGKRTGEFFSDDGQWKADVPIPKTVTLEESVTGLEPEQKKAFIEFVRGMLQWRPEDRKTAAQLAKDPWLYS